MVEGRLDGSGELVISGFSSLEAAGPNDLSFLVHVKDRDKLQQTRAAAVLVPLALEDPPLPVIRVKDPYLASAILHAHLLAAPFAAKGLHPTCVCGSNCIIGNLVTVSAHVVLGDTVQLGERVFIGPGTVIGDNVVIGDDCIIKANVTIEEGSRLGNRVILHPGVVIGSDGYGYATDSRGNHYKRPQVGYVQIDDDVEIGANTCIDRGAFGPTWVKSGVKIDNLVQLGHNVIIGENSLIVAQVGMAGSTTLGRNVVLGGAAKINGHIHFADRVMVAAASAVHDSQPVGAKIGGAPAIPVRQWAKAAALYARLPELHGELKKLRKEMDALQEKIVALHRLEENIHE